MNRSRLLFVLLFVLCLLFLAACGGSSSPATGTVQIRLTDAPATESGIDNVWITVRGVLFHRLDTAEPEDADWIGKRFADNETVTLNLARLSGGAMQTVFDNVSLPTGRYRQILLFVEPTRGRDNVAASARALGLHFNNQVDTATGQAPLRIPDALRGIRLAGTFDVNKSAPLRLAIDFDIGHDIVRIARGTADEYLLKPLLRIFDLARAGAITGRIDAAAASDNAAFYVFKAEQPNADNTFRVVRRFTSLTDNTGRFVFYPIAPGKYDIVLRGRNRKTVIVKGVNVLAGTTPSVGAADLGMVPMPTGTDFQVNTRVSPSGSWVSFYQYLPAGIDPIAYEVRFRHVNPFTGAFSDNISLSATNLRVGNWSTSGAAIAFSDVSPVDNTTAPLNGTFFAVADALLYDRSTPLQVTPLDNGNTLSLGTLIPSAPAVASTARGRIMMFAPGMGLDNGLMLAVRGGLIVDRLDVSGMMGNPGGAYQFANLPGGTVLSPFNPGVYGLETFGWTSATPATFAVGFRNLTLLPPVANLRFGDRGNIDLWMVLLR
ncbi:MAG TPA: DUF4382 domain-containing protein [Candidatus Deferrimicrobiaceae bacterium]|jgi:hypothetical protein